jgi:hypothetical protein
MHELVQIGWDSIIKIELLKNIYFYFMVLRKFFKMLTIYDEI